MITIFWVIDSTRTLPEGGDSTESEVGLLYLDILEKENYTSVASITSHAVEEGIPVSDHIVLKNDKALFTGIVSGRQSNTRLVEGATFGPTLLRDGTEASGVVVPEGTDRRGDVFDKLLELKNSGTLIAVSGLQKDIEDWVIQSVSFPRSVDTAGTLVCDITLSELRTAVLEEIDAPSPRVERGRRRSNNGNVKTKEKEANPELQSVFSSLDDKARGRG